MDVGQDRNKTPAADRVADDDVAEPRNADAIQRQPHRGLTAFCDHARCDLGVGHTIKRTKGPAPGGWYGKDTRVFQSAWTLVAPSTNTNTCNVMAVNLGERDP